MTALCGFERTNTDKCTVIAKSVFCSFIIIWSPLELITKYLFSQEVFYLSYRFFSRLKVAQQKKNSA